MKKKDLFKFRVETKILSSKLEDIKAEFDAGGSAALLVIDLKELLKKANALRLDNIDVIEKEPAIDALITEIENALRDISEYTNIKPFDVD